MSKAEEKTTELMKKAKDFIPDGGYSEKELNLAFFMFIKGYNQAQKDLELTVEDIIIILDVENNILHECNDNSKLVIETYPKGEDYYGEILKRFIEKRNDTR